MLLLKACTTIDDVQDRPVIKNRTGTLLNTSVYNNTAQSTHLGAALGVASWQNIIDAEGLPELPFRRIPIPSAAFSFDGDSLKEECVTQRRPCSNYYELTRFVQKSFDNAGFPGTRIFYGLDGIHDYLQTAIIVSPAERIFADGRPARLDRFSLEAPLAPKDVSFSEFLRVLFSGRDGRLRFFMVVLSQNSYPVVALPPSPIVMSQTLSSGSLSPTQSLAGQTIPSQMTVEVLVYEYSVSRGKSGRPLRNSELTVQNHLAQAGLELTSKVE